MKQKVITKSVVRFIYPEAEPSQGNILVYDKLLVSLFDKDVIISNPHKLKSM